jgi:hypothetical protein
MTRDQAIAWAAGLFEGEGTICVGTHSSNRRKFIRLALSTTDEDVMRRFAAVIGCGRVNGPYVDGRTNNKPRWHWQETTLEGTDKALALLLPFLGERRLQQLADTRAVVEAQPPAGVFMRRGMTHTDEARRKMSEAVKQSWVRRKAAVA